MYETYIGFEFEVEKKISSLIGLSRPLTNYVGSTVRSYHGTINNSKQGMWRIERDDSLRYGAEFISPPQKLEHSLETMKTFLNFVTENGSETSYRCGCHTNMCLMCRGKIVKINEDALLSNINWRLLHTLWKNRIGKDNQYCRNIKNIFKQYKEHGNNLYAEISNKSGIGKEIFKRYHSFVVKKSSLMSQKGTYYELRFPGGTNYHKHPDRIEQTVRHFSDILMKSRQVIFDKSPNKRIVSYINRTYYNINNCGLNKINNINTIDIKTLANNCYEDKKYKNNLDNKVRSAVNCISAELNTSPYTVLTDNEKRKLKRTMCKNHLLYYFLKYAFFNYPKNKSLVNFNPLVWFMGCGITFTIPKDETDTNKLWLSCINSKFTMLEKKQIIKSIKNKKAKKMFNKMLIDKDYRDKIIKYQTDKRQQKTINISTNSDRASETLYTTSTTDN